MVHKGVTRIYRAKVCDGEDRDRLWSWLLEQWSGFEDYRKKAHPRELPIVELQPSV